jgi:hypothetical protein
MSRRWIGAALLLAVACSVRADDLKNWFNDPYFQVRNAVPGCPVPRGPFMSEADMRKDSHARAERGTRCWLEGQCAKPNAYMYDAGIGEAVRKRFAESRELRSSSLWVTVQRRFVWVEGCAADTKASERIRRLLRGTPDVEQVIVDLARSPSARPPYAVLEDR